MTGTIVEKSGTYVFYTSKGEILDIVSNMTLRLALLNKPENCELKKITSENKITSEVYIVDGIITNRPTSANLPTIGSYPLVIDLSVLALGTNLTIANETGQKMEINDFSEELTLTDVGVYTLHAIQPFPYYDIYQEITVA